jgi:hypothetical protein
MMGNPTTAQVLEVLLRVEAKLDAMLAALAEEQDDAPAFDLTLDGQLCGAAREEGTPL